MYQRELLPRKSDLKTRYGINGRFLTRPGTGVDRYAYEIVRILDNLMSRGEAVIILPSKAEQTQSISLSNIIIVRVGEHTGHVWEQVDLARYLKNEGLLGINLCNTAPMSTPGIVCIHDMAVISNAVNYSWRFRLWYRLLYSILQIRAHKIITVSEFSKSEIEKYYPISKGKIEVIPNAWQHMQRIKADDSILGRAGLTKGSYYFAMSSLAPNKNLRWLVETARLNPREVIAIAGGINTKVFGKHDIPQTENVKYLGYVTDGEAKALMQNCKRFLFPTLYEGFGIPPMEAMACDASAVVSDIEVMHEIYGKAVTYVDPGKSVYLDRIPIPTADGRSVLGRYSWESSARALYSIMSECSN